MPTPIRVRSQVHGFSHGLKIARQLSIFTPVCALVPAFRIPAQTKKKRGCISTLSSFWSEYRDSRHLLRWSKLRSCLRRAVGKQLSTGQLHLTVRIPVFLKKESPPKRWTFLVGAPGFEPGASWPRTKRDTKLRHTPIAKLL